jgi:hypothetical protein
MDLDVRRTDRMLRWQIIGAVAAVVGVVVALLALGRDAADYRPFAETTPTPTGTSAAPQLPPDEPTVSPAKRSKAAYLKEADEVCRKWYEANSAEQQSAHADAVKLRNVNGIFHNMVGEWSEVERPPEGDAVIQGILDRFRDANSIMDDMATAFESKDNARYGTLDAASVTAEKSANAAARDYGHRVCGNY